MLMMEWPPRCADCGQPIENWAEAGSHDGAWLHRKCWTERWRTARDRGVELRALRSPVERSRELELPMLASLLLFHFGLAVAIAGWIMLTRDEVTVGLIALAIGVIAPVLGAAGIMLNIISRRRIEVIRQSLEARGGWKLSQ
jgi:hypothetical protein